MNNRVRWVKSDNGNVDDSASDAAPTLARSPMTWERASKVLTDGRPEAADLDADDTNPVPALTRQRARVDGTEEIDVNDVLEVAESQRPMIAASATSEVSVDDVLEEVAAPASERERKTEPPSSRSRKTEPPSSRNRKTDPPSSARLIPQSAAVPHWTDPSLEIPRPAPLPSTPPWVSDARASDPRRETTIVGFHARPAKPAQSRAPWLALGAAAGAVVAALIVVLILPSSDSSTVTAGSTARVPTFHGSVVKHRVERSTGHGPVVPVFAVSALPR